MTNSRLQGCKLPIYESRVSFRGGGKRMLWQYRGPPPAAILVWYVVDHKHVSDKLRTATSTSFEPLLTDIFSSTSPCMRP